jgi:methyl-accepting chemotaxis protein
MKIKLSLFKKLVVANLLYAIPVIALVWLMIDAKNGNINFGRQEVKGNQFQVRLEKVFLEFNHLKIESYIAGKIQTNLFPKVDDSITELLKIHAELGNDLQFNDEGLSKRKRDNLKLTSFQERWDTFKKNSSNKNNTEGTKELAGFIADVRGMITHVGDTSNLILDPDLDSYYLMDVTLLALPQMQDRLQDITQVVSGKIPADGKINQQDKIDIAVYSALLKQSDLDRITADTQTVIQEDPNFFGESPSLKSKLDPAIQKLAKQTETFLEVLNRLSQEPVAPVSSEEFIKLGKALNDQAFIAWDVAYEELNVLLNKRIASLEKEKYQSLAFALFALAVAGFILFWIATSFNSNIKNILGQLKKSLLETNESSDELVNLSTKLSNSTNDQASAVQQTATALEEINALVKTTVTNTENANQSAAKSLLSAERSGNSVESLSSAMKEISNNSDHILDLMNENGNKMNHITEIISSIGDKTKVINEIVFQTKLLSFNASVEAARAGEAGKGFSVVAEEVGNLATMSGSASKDITGMLSNSIEEVTRISKETQTEIGRALKHGREKVENGNLVVEEFNESLSEILRQFKDVKENVDSINRAANEQAQGIQEITEAIAKIDSITHENASMSRQTADQSENISKQSKILGQIVSTIEEEILGQKTAS